MRRSSSGTTIDEHPTTLGMSMTEPLMWACRHDIMQLLHYYGFNIYDLPEHQRRKMTKGHTLQNK